MGPAPVAPLSINVINDIKDCVPQVSFIDRELLTVRSGLNSVVDGQQRITTNYKAYINHDDFRNIVLDLGKGMFVEAREGIKENQIPVGVLLFRDTNLFDDYTDKCPELGNPLTFPELYPHCHKSAIIESISDCSIPHEERMSICRLISL